MRFHLGIGFLLAITAPSLVWASMPNDSCEKEEIGASKIADDGENVIACLKTGDANGQIWKPFSEASKLFSSTCEDWKAARWDSKDACIMDGRWHLVYANDQNGHPAFGNLDELRRYMDLGADVKNADYSGSGQHVCQAAGWYGQTVMCLGGFREQGEPWRNDIQPNDKTNGLGAVVRRSDGARISANIIPKDDGSLDLHVFPTYTGMAFKWFVKF